MAHRAGKDESIIILYVYVCEKVKESVFCGFFCGFQGGGDP